MTTDDFDGPRAGFESPSERMARRIAFELRSGCPILVNGDRGATLIAALDAMSPADLAWLLVGDEDKVVVVVGAGRAASVLPEAEFLPPDEAVSLSIPRGALDVAAVLDASRPLVEPRFRAANIGNEAWAIPLLRLARTAGLLPALLAVNVAGARYRVDGLLVVDGDVLPDLGLERVDDVRLLPSECAELPLGACESARVMTFRAPGRAAEYLAVMVGDPTSVLAPLVRLHSSCLTGDLLGSLRCDCGAQLKGAVARMAAEGCGLLVYLPHEGRGIGLTNKIRAYRLQDAGVDTVDANHLLGFASDARLYGAAAAILRHCATTRIRLLSNNPEKVRSLTSHGIEIVERVPHIVPATDFNARYMATKGARCGHSFEVGGEAY